MTQSEQIKNKIMDLVTATEDQRQRPHSVVMTVSSILEVPIFRVKKVLENLVKERKLVFTYRDPCSYVEMPFKDVSRGAPPTKVVVDGEGNPWICAQDVDPSEDLAAQGCWQLEKEGSSQND